MANEVIVSSDLVDEIRNIMNTARQNVARQVNGEQLLVRNIPKAPKDILPPPNSLAVCEYDAPLLSFEGFTHDSGPWKGREPAGGWRDDPQMPVNMGAALAKCLPLAVLSVSPFAMCSLLGVPSCGRNAVFCRNLIIMSLLPAAQR